MVSVGRLLNGGDELPLGLGVIVTVLGVDAGIDELGGTDVDEIDVVGGTDVGVPGDVVGELQDYQLGAFGWRDMSQFD